MILLAAAAWAWLAAPLPAFGPGIPPMAISYLGRPGSHRGPRPDGIAGMAVTTAANAEAIEFSGGFDIGATAAMEAAMAAAPLARLVAFDSPGGRPLAAEGVAEVIRAHHLDTTVSRSCASACTIAYLAGTVRTAAPDARFLFHLGTGPVMASFSATVVLQIERRWFVRGGASLSFAERALHAPNPAPYLAPIDELMAAGYVHHSAGAALTAPVRGGPVTLAVTAIEKLTGGALLWGQARRVRDGMAPARSAAVAEQRAGLVVDRWLSRSSDRAVLGLVDATLAALTDLRARDPVACMRWQVGLEDQDQAASLIEPALHARLAAAQVMVLADANAYPTPAPQEDGSLEAADLAVRRAVAGAFGARALVDSGSREHGFDDPARSCSASIAYLRGLRQAPNAARLLRWALAAG